MTQIGERTIRKLRDRTFNFYKIDCPDGRSYVGATVSPIETRFAGHVSESRGYYSNQLNEKGIGAAIRRFGAENLILTHIATARGAENAALVETALIDQHGTLSPHGYNLRRASAVPRGVKHGDGISLKAKRIPPRDYIWIKAGPCKAWPLVRAA